MYPSFQLGKHVDPGVQASPGPHPGLPRGPLGWMHLRNGDVLWAQGEGMNWLFDSKPTACWNLAALLNDTSGSVR